MTHLSEAILHDTKAVILTLHDTFVCTALQDYADFFVYDAAARPVSVEVLKALIAASGDKPFLVRTENSQPAVLQHYLNLGADGLIFTDILHAAEAEKAIAACLYPPEGTRPFRALSLQQNLSLEVLNDQLTLIVEISHPQSVAQIEEIAEVTGVNGVLVCPQRLAVAMDRKFDVDHPQVQQAIQHVMRAAQSYELPFGIEGASDMYAANFVLPCRDIDFIAAGIAANPEFTLQAEEKEVALFAMRE